MTTATPIAVAPFVEKLTTESDFIRRENPKPGWVYNSYHELLLEHGTPRTETVRTDEILGAMEPQACWYNAMLACHQFTGYTYVEGLALADFILVRHAWLENEHGQVIDPTWINLRSYGTFHFNGVASYLGIPFENNFLFKNAVITGFPSFFEDDWRHDFQILKRGLLFDDQGQAYDFAPTGRNAA